MRGPSLLYSHSPDGYPHLKGCDHMTDRLPPNKNGKRLRSINHLKDKIRKEVLGEIEAEENDDLEKAVKLAIEKTIKALVA